MAKQRSAKSRQPGPFRVVLLAVLAVAFAFTPVALTVPRLFGGSIAAAPIPPNEQPGAEQPGAEQPGTGAGQPGANLPPELRECTTPAVQFVVKRRVGEDRMTVLIRVNDISTPARLKANAAGARAYIDQAFEAEGSSTREVDYDLTFTADGRHLISVEITDACGRIYTYSYAVATPFIDFTAELTCTGTIDANGYCIVPRNKDIDLTIPTGNGTWTWDDGASSPATRSRSFSGSPPLVFAQARAFSAAGMRVTPVLPFAIQVGSLPRITGYLVPDLVRPDEPFTVSFERPAGSDVAEASIWVDDRQVTVGLSAELRLEPGIHTIAFVLAWPQEGGVVTRQAAVVVPERPQAFGLIERLWGDPTGQVLLAAIGGLLAMLLLVLLVVGSRLGYRRIRGIFDGPISPFQAFRLLADGSVTVEQVERISRRCYRFTLRTARGRSETVEVTAGSLRYAWEALISELVRRGA